MTVSISPGGKAALLLASSFALMATAIPSPALPQLAEYFAGREHDELLSRLVLQGVTFLSDAPDSEFIIKFYVLSIAALFIAIGAPISGWLCDTWGRRPVLILSLGLFGISGGAGFFIDSLTSLLVTRAILGFAVGGIRASTGAMVGDFFQGEDRNIFLGLQSSMMKWGGVVFLLIGSGLANLGWRPPFLIYLLAFFVLPLAIFSLHESLPETAVSASADAAPVEPIPRLGMCYVLLGTFISSAAFFATPMEVPFFVRQAFPELAPAYGGIAAAVANTVAALIAVIYFRVQSRLRYAEIFGCVFIVIALGYFMVALASGYEMVIVGMVIGGLAFGLIPSNQMAWALAIVPPSRRGYVIGLTTLAMYLGQFATPIITEALQAEGQPHALFRNMALVMGLIGTTYVILPLLFRSQGGTADPKSI